MNSVVRSIRGGLTAVFMAALASTNVQGQVLRVVHDEGVLTSIEFEDFDVTASMTSAPMSYTTLRIHDVFAPGESYGFTMFSTEGISFSVDDNDYSISMFGANGTSTGGGAENDIMMWLYLTSGSSFSLLEGQTISLGGSALVTSQPDPALLPPMSGSYSAVFASGSNSEILTDTFTVEFVGSGSAVPEPSTYALICGAGALGVVLLRRRSRSIEA